MVYVSSARGLNWGSPYFNTHPSHKGLHVCSSHPAPDVFHLQKLLSLDQASISLSNHITHRLMVPLKFGVLHPCLPSKTTRQQNKYEQNIPRTPGNGMLVSTRHLHFIEIHGTRKEDNKTMCEWLTTTPISLGFPQPRKTTRFDFATLRLQLHHSGRCRSGKCWCTVVDR